MSNTTAYFNLKLTTAELNLIFKALGRLPFEQVYELIGNINTQANDQMSQAGGNGSEYPRFSGFETHTDGTEKS